MVLFVVSFMDVVVTFRKNQDVDFTFVLPAGTTECFYQTVAGHSSMEVEYQVRQTVVIYDLGKVLIHNIRHFSSVSLVVKISYGIAFRTAESISRTGRDSKGSKGTLVLIRSGR